MIIHDQVFFLRASVVFAMKLGRSRKSFEHFCNILVKKTKTDPSNFHCKHLLQMSPFT